MPHSPPRECPPDRRARLVIVAISSEHTEVPPVGTEYVLDRSPIFFGLRSGCLPDPRDIAVGAAGMTRSHAWFELRDNGWWVHDNASTNGTWVNGKIVKSSKLTDGARVTMGDEKSDSPLYRGVTFEFHKL